jgi:hypothetical protein
MTGKYLLSYVDYLTYLLTCFAALFVLSFIQITEDGKKGNVIEKAEFIVEVQWADMSPNDIDLWVAGPSNTIVYFSHPDGQIIILDRDDMGINNTLDGVVNPIRREVVTIRKNVPGEYTVNAMMYKNRNGATERPKVVIRKLNPYAELIEKTLELTTDGEEKTILSFTIDEDGNVISQDELEVPLFTRAGG